MSRSIPEKNFVFVGGTSGIGRAIAVEVARRGASILIVGRDAARGTTTTQMLLDAGARDATWLAADLASVSGTANAGKQILDWREKIDGVVHSAMNNRIDEGRRITVDGLEYVFALQYLARAALNLALREALVASGDGRVVHIGAKPPARLVPDLEDPQFMRRKWTLLSSLMSSQVLGFLHVQEATRRWADFPVSLAIACVGPTNTDATREQPWWVRALYALIATTPERSAKNAIRFLLDDDVRPLRGHAFYDPKHYVASPIAYDGSLASKAWTVTKELLAASIDAPSSRRSPSS